ncbi:MAG: efflux RND transporter permease subunit [Spongiibacteraceae bacterium]
MYRSYESLIVKYSHAIVRWRWLVLLASLAISVAMLMGATKLTFSTDYRVYFGPNNPQLVAFDSLQEVYNKDDGTIIAIQTPNDDAFNPSTLKLLRDMTEAGWQLPYAQRVESLANYQHTEADGDDLYVDDLVGEEADFSPSGLAKTREIAMNEPLLLRRLISDRGHAAAIIVTHQFPGDDIGEMPEAVKATRELLDQFQQTYPDHRFYLSGPNMLNNAFVEASQADMKTLFPAMYTLLLIVLFALLRSVLATLASLVIILLATGTAMGMAGHLGIGLSSPSSIAPIVVTSLAVADAVHILVTFFNLMRGGESRIPALIESMRLNFTPVLLTSVTTAIGLLTLNFADSPPLQDLGNISAMGAILAWFLSLTMLPALIAILPIRTPRAQASPLSNSLARFGALVVRHRSKFLYSSATVCIALMALVPLNEPNDMFARYFDERIEFRNDTDYMVDNITGLYTLQFSLPAPNGVADPAYLKTLERFKTFWLEHPKALQVASISDIFKRLNKNMHGDDPDYYRLPEQVDLAAQYLLLYEMSLPYGLDLTNMINMDKTASKFIVVFEHLKSKETRALATLGEQWLRDHAPEQFSYASSPPVMFSYIAKRNFESMAISIPLALVGISILLILALRSVKFGLLSLIPNLFPMGMAFGIWAIYDGEINFAMSFAMGLVLGIIVDDTIHFMSKYLLARREQGLSAEEAVVYAMRTVGTALVVTSLVLAAGFGVLSYSAFYPSSSMALLTIIAIVCALAVDFILLPTLLLKFDRKKICS